MNKLPTPDDIFAVLQQIYKLEKQWSLAREDRGFCRFVKERMPASEVGYRMQAGNIRSAIRGLTSLLDDVQELEDFYREEIKHERTPTGVF